MKTDSNIRDLSCGVIAGLLLALMAVLAGGAALRESVAIDEVAHIGVGVSYLQKLDPTPAYIPVYVSSCTSRCTTQNSGAERIASPFS